VKSSLPRRLLIALACVITVLVIGWWSWHSSGEAPGSIRALAMKAAGGDPQSVSQLKALGSNAVPGLVEVLEDQDSNWRGQVWTLAPKLLPRRMARALLAKVRSPDSSAVRAAGAKALALLGAQAEAAVPNLLLTLHDREPYIALEAAAALAQIGKPSIPGLTIALSDTNAVVRHAAAYGLGEIGLAAEPAVPELIEALQDPDPTVRSSTAYSLAIIGFPSLLALSNVIDHADADARAVAVKEFFRFYRSLRLMTPALNKMAHAQDAASRRLAIEALGSLRAADEASLNTLILSLKDPVEEVRLAALRSLNLVPGHAEAFLAALKGCLQDRSPAVRAWAAKDLGAMGPSARSLLDDLAGALRDSEPDVRAAARQAMEKIQACEPAKN